MLSWQALKFFIIIVRKSNLVTGHINAFFLSLIIELSLLFLFVIILSCLEIVRIFKLILGVNYSNRNDIALIFLILNILYLIVKIIFFLNLIRLLLVFQTIFSIIFHLEVILAINLILGILILLVVGQVLVLINFELRALWMLLEIIFVHLSNFYNYIFPSIIL